MKNTEYKKHLLLIINRGLLIDGVIIKPLDVIDSVKKVTLIKTLMAVIGALEASPYEKNHLQGRKG